MKINVLFSLRQWVGSLICYSPLFPFSTQVTVTKKEYLIQLPLVYRWVMTVAPLLNLALPLPPPSSFFIVNYYWSSLGMRGMTRHSMKNYRVLYSLVNWRGLPLRLALGWKYHNSIYTRWFKGRNLRTLRNCSINTPNTFLAEELYLKHYEKWCKMPAKNPSDSQLQVLKRIRVEVSIFA